MNITSSSHGAHRSSGVAEAGAEGGFGAALDRGATAREVVGSLLFYALFYTGTIFYAIAGLVAARIAPARLPAVIRRWSWFHRDCARVLLGIRIAVSGEPPTGAVLVALKHQSFFEAIDLPRLLDNPAIFAKAELLRLPLWGPAGLAYGLIPVEREAGAPALRAMISTARRLTAHGRVLAIFPEGTRVPVGAPALLQSGFAGVYKLLGLPVVPAAVASGALYHRLWKRSGTVQVVFGDGIAAGLPREEVEARVLAAINLLETRQPPRTPPHPSR